MWGYRQVLTMAQVELLACDTPIVVYKRDTKGRKHTKKEMDELTRRWKEKNQKCDGQRFSLNDFLRTGKIEK